MNLRIEWTITKISDLVSLANGHCIYPDGYRKWIGSVFGYTEMIDALIEKAMRLHP